MRGKVYVERVIDGDTFVAKTVTVLSPELVCQERTSFRLLRVDTPERKQPGFNEATKFLKDWVEKCWVVVRPINKKRKRDSFGRFLVDVFAPLARRGGLVNVSNEIKRRKLGKRGKKHVYRKH